jgi:hypothetical protein
MTGTHTGEPRRNIHVPGNPNRVRFCRLTFVVWRSRPVYVIDLSRRVGLPGETADQRLIIAQAKDDSELMAFPPHAKVRSLRNLIAHSFYNGGEYSSLNNIHR